VVATEGDLAAGAYREGMSACLAAVVRADPQRVREAVAMRSCDAPVTVRETHISWVFVAGDRAFKLKKPVVLDFVDYGTPARRQAMCQEEVRLNARLAPDLYVGVRSVADRGDRLEVVERERQRFEPLDEVATSRHLLVRTDREPDAVIADLLALLDLRLEGEPTARDLTSSGDATLPRRGPQRRPQSTSAA
jgi:hypothetical protein